MRLCGKVDALFDLHTSKRMHFIEERWEATRRRKPNSLHTSKRMHFIEDRKVRHAIAKALNLHTSKRMHFIEEYINSVDIPRIMVRAYVKTYALH